MRNCIFCKIFKGEIPAHIIYNNEDVLSFLDINPHAKGHTVVIPKIHAKNIFELNEEQTKNLMFGVKKTMEKIQKVLNPDGFNVGWNQNPVAGQVIPHLHIHILPRYKNDGGGSMHSIIKNPGNVPVGERAKLFKK